MLSGPKRSQWGIIHFFWHLSDLASSYFLDLLYRFVPATSKSWIKIFDILLGYVVLSTKPYTLFISLSLISAIFSCHQVAEDVLFKPRRMFRKEYLNSSFFVAVLWQIVSILVSQKQSIQLMKGLPFLSFYIMNCIDICARLKNL